MLLHFAIHQMALGLFRMMAAIARDMTISNTFGSAAMLAIFLLGGFIVPKDSIKPWWIWAFWLSPLSYAQRAISVNEFTASRWMKRSGYGNNTVGHNVLHSHGLPTDAYWYWLGFGVILVYAIFFNIMCTFALTYLKRIQATMVGKKRGDVMERGMILPFQPLSMTFHNVNYFVDMPKGMRKQGAQEERLQLLSNVNGAFRPGTLTALVGSSGAGKTTLMDVLAGRKTGGYIEGDIRISGYPKEQRTFARVSGYVEQNDIHSPQVTVAESLWFSSSLRLPKEVSREKRVEFVKEVMALVELDSLQNALVGLPGSTGLTTEQRKRLTIAVELVANPSIIFMDEPTSGLDARAAAIVMRTVRNTVDTGRTVVCTIHQPSIDIFEAFDELLLLKRGGCVIYGGPLGKDSQIMIDYFQGVPGVPPIPNGYNPATWMLEVTTQSREGDLGLDFADIYKNSTVYRYILFDVDFELLFLLFYQYKTKRYFAQFTFPVLFPREVEALIQQLSIPAAGTEALKFSSEFSQDSLTQFKICYWKQNCVYWRSPRYNIVRLSFTTISALIFGSVFWDAGSKRETTEGLFVVMGALYSACIFLGVNNASSIQPVISIERTVYYRERATGMYSPFPYALAQGLVEIPYIGVQTIIFGVMTFFMINYERTVGILMGEVESVDGVHGWLLNPKKYRLFKQAPGNKSSRKATRVRE
ncbi:hypothetical protein Taro_048780 [Colocasia esculenta]|uniref:ABC transporter domain-containing protein n=1 Tax=Colocasia esculenta TaxID=4460 RepID=A0A843X916_COLES|nr:hypothetical protein [Colocasia esculenta]